MQEWFSPRMLSLLVAAAQSDGTGPLTPLRVAEALLDPPDVPPSGDKPVQLSDELKDVLANALRLARRQGRATITPDVLARALADAESVVPMDVRAALQSRANFPGTDRPQAEPIQLLRPSQQPPADPRRSLVEIDDDE